MNEEKRVLILDRYEYGAMITIINEKRNNLLKERKDTEFVNEILKKVLKAPTKSKRFYQKEKNLSYER